MQTDSKQTVRESCWNQIGVQGDRSCPRLIEAIHCRNCPVFSDAGQQLFQRETPQEYLEEWTQRIAEVAAGAASDESSVLVFRIGDEWLALDTHSAVEVVETRPIHRVPHRTNRLFLGLANIRGELNLCVSLKELLGIESDHESHPTKPAASTVAKERLLVVEHDQHLWVFPVDEVEGVCRIPADAFKELPHTVEKSAKFYSKAIFSHRDANVGMLSEERIFQALEKAVQ